MFKLSLVVSVSSYFLLGLIDRVSERPNENDQNGFEEIQLARRNYFGIIFVSTLVPERISRIEKIRIPKNWS